MMRRQTAIEELETLLTESQAAERIAVPISTLRYWRSTGTGPNFFRLGRAVRYGPSALQQFIQLNLHISNAETVVEGVMRHAR
jgi:DNA-binding transcriptional MerR regulator